MYMKPCDYCPDRSTCPRYHAAQASLKGGETRVYSVTIGCVDFKKRHWPGERVIIEHEAGYARSEYETEHPSLMDATGTVLGWQGYRVVIRLDEPSSKGNVKIRLYPAKKNGMDSITIQHLEEPDRAICPGCGVPEGIERPEGWEDCPCDEPPDKRFMAGHYPYPCCAGKKQEAPTKGTHCRLTHNCPTP